MITINLTYDAETRLMSITSESTGEGAVATTGDDQATRMVFDYHDPSDTLEGFSARVEFGVNLIDEQGSSYRPYLMLDSENSVTLPNTILSAVKCGLLPFQLAFVRGESTTRVEFYSLNTLTLAVNKALDALHSPSERDPKFGDVLYEVQYNDTTATFTFTRVDGSIIEIALTDLAEDHYEVSTRAQLVTLNQAQTGDTATVLDTGIWYKLYGTYSVLNDWYAMPGGAVLNGSSTAYPSFYAPTTHGVHNDTLLSRGVDNAPVWVNLNCRRTLDFTGSIEDVTVPLYEQGLPILDMLDGDSSIQCSFNMDGNGEVVDLPYSVDYDVAGRPISISVTSLIHGLIVMNIRVIPDRGDD